MKNTFFLFFMFFGLCFASAQVKHDVKNPARQKQEITEQDYLDALAYFDSDVALAEDTLKKAMNTAMIYLMRSRNTQGQIYLYEKSAQYAQRTGQMKEYIDLKSNKAQMLLSNNQPEEALVLIDSLIHMEEIEKGLLGRFYKAKGDAYGDLQNLDEAEKNFLKGLEIAEQVKDTFQIGVCYTSLANIHNKLGNVYDAIDYNIKGLNILEQGDHPYIITGACKVLCSIFQDLGNYDKAQEYAEKMDQICRMKGYKQMGAVANAALGKQAMHRQDYNEALKYFNLANEEYNRKTVRMHAAFSDRTSFNVKIDMVRCYFKNNDIASANALIKEMEKTDISTYFEGTKLGYHEIQIESAINSRKNDKVRSHLKEAEALITPESSFKLKKQLAKLSSRVAEYFGDYKKANESLNAYFAYKDSIESEQKSQLVHNMEAKYQKAEQEKKISKLNFENEKAESEIKQKNIVLIIGAIGLAILSFLVFQFYKLYQTNKKNKEQLAAQNIVVSKALDDKNTLLKEIHHRVKNNLQVISSLLSLQSRYIKDEDTLDAIKAGKSRVQSMSLLHQNLYRDDNLKGVEMKQYFQNLGQNLFDTYNIEENISLTMDIDDMTLDIDTVVPIGLITNELISNALKHAFKERASGNIHLSLKDQGDALHLIVKDDGVGLPDGELPVSYKSLGATLIQSFAEKLEGNIKIDISEGTKVVVEIKDYTLV